MTVKKWMCEFLRPNFTTASSSIVSSPSGFGASFRYLFLGSGRMETAALARRQQVVHADTSM